MSQRLLEAEPEWIFYRIQTSEAVTPGGCGSPYFSIGMKLGKLRAVP